MDIEGLAIRLFEGSPSDAVAAAGEILALTSDGADTRTRVIALCARARQELDIELLEEASSALTEDVWRARVLNMQGAIACTKGRFDQAEEIYRRSLEISRKHGYATLEATALLNLGLVADSRGDPERGLELIQVARRLFRRVGDRVREGAALVSMGNVYKTLGAYADAIEALTDGVNELEGAGWDSMRCTGLASLSRSYTRAGVPDEAVRCAEEALKLSAPVSTGAVWALNALVHAHVEGGDHDAALEAGRRGVEVARATGSDYPLVFALVNLADALVEVSRLEEAEAAYQECSAIVERMDLAQPRTSCLAGMCRILERRGDFEGALAFAEPLLENAERFGERQALLDAHRVMSRLAEATGDPSRALTHLKRSQELASEVFTREMDIRVRSIKAAQELGRERDRSAAVLQSLSRRVMESQEEERRRIASELHDGLGQELALLGIEADLLAQSPPEELAGPLRGLAERVQSLADQVQGISRALHPARLRQLGLVAALDVLCSEVASARGLEVVFESDDVPEQIPDDVGLCAYRIAQEALANATRHGEARRVEVRLGRTGEGIRLDVVDDGIGFDPEETTAPGVGIASMRERAHHLGGRFHLASRPGEGARIEAVLPR